MKKTLVQTAIVAAAIVAAVGFPAAQGQSASSAKFEETFLSSVPQHHEDAVQMAQVCIQKAVHPELKALCQNIISSQTEQAQEMQGWLQSWYGGRNTAPADMMAKMQAMQGQMMAKLNAANGPNFDHVFLENMGQHHAEGMPEFKECVAHAEHAQLKALCGKMEASQQQQLTAMNAWAKAWKK